jgi:hypothetical protein
LLPWLDQAAAAPSVRSEGSASDEEITESIHR